MYFMATHILFQFIVDLSVGLCDLHQNHTYEDIRNNFKYISEIITKKGKFCFKTFQKRKLILSTECEGPAVLVLY